LAAGAASPTTPKKAKACIFIFLWGGPAQQDTLDPKPDAPVEYRGEFSTIQTALPGIRVCEHLPGIAKRLDLDMIDHFGRGDEATLVAEVVSADQPTLVVWDHGHIPTLTRAVPLAPGTEVPDAWPEDRFDLYWVLTPGESGYSLTIAPQELLAGDAPSA
jgi:hypothetical protein